MSDTELKRIMVYEAVALVIVPFGILLAYIAIVLLGVTSPLGGILFIVYFYIILKVADSNFYPEDIPTRIMLLRLLIAVLVVLSAIGFQSPKKSLNDIYLPHLIKHEASARTSSSYTGVTKSYAGVAASCFLGLLFVVSLIRIVEFILIIINRIIVYGFNSEFQQLVHAAQPRTR